MVAMMLVLAGCSPDNPVLECDGGLYECCRTDRHCSDVFGEDWIFSVCIDRGPEGLCSECRDDRDCPEPDTACFREIDLGTAVQGSPDAPRGESRCVPIALGESEDRFVRWEE